jgi:hypothetical protein
MRMAILNFVLMPLAFIVAARWKGPSGVAAAWLVLSPVTVIPLVIMLLNCIKLSFREYAMALLPVVAGSVVICRAVFGMNGRLPASWPLAIRLAVQVSVGGATYAAVILGFFRQRVLRYVKFISDLRNPNRTSEPVVS